MSKIGVFVGSLREESFSKKIAKHTVTLFPASSTVETIRIEQLPFYNQDYDDSGNTPEEYDAFREKMQSFDAFLFVIPEYNRSFPAVIKNALDVGSRPKADNVWNNKPAAIISQSPGNIGAFGANHHLRQVLTAVNMPVVQHPEMYIGGSANLIGEDGLINNEDTVAFLQSFIDQFMILIEKHREE